VPGLTDVERGLAAAAQGGGLLDLTGATDREVRAEVLRDLLTGGHGVRLTGARVVGALDLEGARLGGALRLVECELTGPVSLRGAELPLLDLRRSRLVSLSATESTVERVVLLSGIEVGAGLSLDGARVGAGCSLQGAVLRNPDGPALAADRVRLSSELLMHRLVAEGTGRRGAVRLQGARVDGRISGHGLEVTNPSGPALVADSLQVADTVYLGTESVLRGCGDRGAVRFVGARVGSLSLGGTRLENPSGWALAAHYLEVTGTLYLDRIEATGGVRVSGGRIGGQLDLAGAMVDGGERPALAATRLQVAQAVVLDGATLRSSGADPTVDLRSARIAGDLEMRQTRLSHPGGIAIRLNTATVEGRVIASETDVASGTVDFRDSTVGQLYDAPERLPPGVAVEVSGLVYRGVPGHPGVTVAERIRWLARMPAYAAQPYRQLAAAYQASGHLDDARRVLVAQQEHLRRSGALTGWSRLRHRLFGLTLRYGYQPLRAVALLAATLLAAAVIFGLGAGGTRTGPGGGPCPAVDRVGLAIDTAVPLVSTGAGNRCQLATDTRTGQLLAASSWLLTLLGWGSATLVVAGYTGLVRRP
jgi:hypothetical protein